jgi:hypothetical protein
VPSRSARLPIFCSIVSRFRNSFGLASAQTLLISAACLRKTGAINSLPFAVSDRCGRGRLRTLRCPIEFRGRLKKIHPSRRWRHPAARSNPTPSLRLDVWHARQISVSGSLPCEIRHEPQPEKLLERTYSRASTHQQQGPTCALSFPESLTEESRSF